jgi:ankyrin repeat protein
MASKDSALLQAASEGDISKVTKLIESDEANINAQGAMNRSALHLACLYGKMEVVMYLIEKGANKDIQASSGEGNEILKIVLEIV